MTNSKQLMFSHSNRYPSVYFTWEVLITKKVKNLRFTIEDLIVHSRVNYVTGQHDWQGSFWPVKSPFLPNSVRWPAVIFDAINIIYIAWRSLMLLLNIITVCFVPNVFNSYTVISFISTCSKLSIIANPNSHM